MAPTNAAASPTAASCGPARQAVVRLSAAKLEEDDADAPPDDAALRTSGAVDEDDADARGGDGGGAARPVAADAAGIALFGGAAVDAEGPGDSERALLAGDAVIEDICSAHTGEVFVLARGPLPVGGGACASTQRDGDSGAKRHGTAIYQLPVGV